MVARISGQAILLCYDRDSGSTEGILYDWQERYGTQSSDKVELMTEEHIQENKDPPKTCAWSRNAVRTWNCYNRQNHVEGISKVLPILKDISLLHGKSSEPSDWPLWDCS